MRKIEIVALGNTKCNNFIFQTNKRKRKNYIY